MHRDTLTFAFHYSGYFALVHQKLYPMQARSATWINRNPRGATSPISCTWGGAVWTHTINDVFMSIQTLYFCTYLCIYMYTRMYSYARVCRHTYMHICTSRGARNVPLACLLSISLTETPRHVGHVHVPSLYRAKTYSGKFVQKNPQKTG